MDYYISKSGHKYVNDIDNYCNGKIIEVISKKSGLKYLMCTTNKIELMMEMRMPSSLLTTNVLLTPIQVAGRSCA